MALCQICHKNKASQKHHLLSKKTKYVQLYPEFIHDKRNIMEVCADCHLVVGSQKLSELEFCQMFKIRPRSKSLQNMIVAGKIENFWE
jgi:hypothetical protein